MPHAAARTPPLLARRRTAAAQTSRRPAADCLAGVLARALGHFAADGAHGDLAAARRTDAAGSSELELARIRHACWLLATEAHVRFDEDHPHSRDQRAHL